jgi:hypothetical protein
MLERPLRARSPWQIHRHDIGIVPDSIEHDLGAVRRYIEVPDHRTGPQIGQLTPVATRQLDPEKILSRRNG